MKTRLSTVEITISTLDSWELWDILFCFGNTRIELHLILSTPALFSLL